MGEMRPLAVVSELGTDIANSINFHLYFHLPLKNIVRYVHNFIAPCSALVAQLLATSPTSKCWDLFQ